MKALTKEQIEYIELKLRQQRMVDTYKRMKDEMSCWSHVLPEGYPKCETIFETFVYQRMEQLKQEKLKQP